MTEKGEWKWDWDAVGGCYLQYVFSVFWLLCSEFDVIFRLHKICIIIPDTEARCTVIFFSLL